MKRSWVIFYSVWVFFGASLFAEPLAHKPFIVVSPPKCGTHLIGKVLELLLDKPCAYELCELGSTSNTIELIEQHAREGRFVVAHNFNEMSLEILTARGYGVIFLMRDPRDQLISVQNWLQEGQWPWITAAKIADRKEQLSELVTGEKYGWKCVDSCFLSYAERLKRLPRHTVYNTRFENLVGFQGGGEFYRQVIEIMKLAAFLEIPISPDFAEGIAVNVFGGTRTFRQGQIGAWKNHFSSSHKKAFKFGYTQLLIELGYEKNHDW